MSSITKVMFYLNISTCVYISIFNFLLWIELNVLMNNRAVITKRILIWHNTKYHDFKIKY